MTLITRNAAQDIAPRLFDSFFLKDLHANNAFNKRYASKGTPSVPAVNVSVNEDAFMVELVAPGLKKECFNIALENDLLTISYKEETKADEDQKKNYLLSEYATGSFSRSFTFPKGAIDEEKITASYVDGILRLELLKREEAKPKGPRQITVA